MMCNLDHMYINVQCTSVLQMLIFPRETKVQYILCTLNTLKGLDTLQREANLSKYFCLLKKCTLKEKN